MALVALDSHRMLLAPLARRWLRSVIMTLCIVMLLPLHIATGARANAESARERGLRAFKANDYKRAFPLLLPHADAGDPKSQHAVGYMLFWGHGVAPNELKALGYLEKAAKQGYAPAQEELGSLLLTRAFNARIMARNGERDSSPVPIRPDLAIKWLMAAARQGYTNAYAALQSAYCYGTGVPEDHGVADGWWALYLGPHAKNPDYWSGNTCDAWIEPTMGFILQALETADELRRKHNLPSDRF
jgi:hypothetical protein